MTRELQGFYKWLCLVFPWVGIGVAIFYVFRFNIAGMVMLNSAFVALLLGVFMPMVFLLYPATKKSPLNRAPWYDQLFCWLSILLPAFVFIYALPLSESIWQIKPPPVPFALGIISWLLLLEGVRRIAGWPMSLVVGLISIYPMFASHLPGLLFAKSYSLERMVAFHFLTTQSVFGIPLHVFGQLIIGFLVFGAAMDVTGASRFLLSVAQALMGKVRGGAALVAVMASAFMATLSGSPTANVVSIGTVTIPAMKKAGYPAHVAGAIEAVASNAGMLTPPVMGAIAFIMAGMLQIPYIVVCIAAIIPMVIFYISLFATVYIYAQKHKMPTLPASEIPSLKKVLAGGWYYIGTVAVLLYLLFWVRVEAWAPYYATIFLFVCAFLRKQTRPTLRTLYDFTFSLARLMSLLAVIMAGIGLILGGLGISGLANSLASDLVKISGGNLYILLLLGGTGAFVLGMGGSMTAIYIFMATVFAPSLTQVGVQPISSHMFFMYWAALSCITPPVCTTVFMACAISGSSPMKTGWTATKLAISIYVIPFAFVLNPGLLMEGSWFVILYSTLAALVGGIILAFATEGYIIGLGYISKLARVPIFIVGFILFFRPLEGAICTAVMVAIAVWLYLIRRKREIRSGL